MKESSLIKIKNIQKTYHLGENEFYALDGINIEIEQGDFVAIMGPSGSGKSTLAHILGLLDIPTQGEYFLDGKLVSGLNEDELAVIRRDEIGFIFQQFNLLPKLNAIENVKLPTFYSKLKKAKETSFDLLEKVGLRDRFYHRPNELSGGQQQRVAIARSLVNFPRIILADEPTGNLDSQSENEVMKILQGLNEQGITVVMVTHEEEIALRANRLIRMRDGAIHSDERLKDIHQSDVSREKPERKKTNFFSEMIEHFFGAFKFLLANKVRTFLSILGILIGVAAVVSMMAIGRGAQDQIQEQMARLGTNLLVLRPGARRVQGVMQEAGASSRLISRDAKFLEKAIPSIRRISPKIRGGGQVTFEGNNWNTRIEGVWPSYEYMRASSPQAGRFFTEQENAQRERVALLGTTVFQELFGDQNPIGQSIKINSINFQVIGVLEEKGGAGWRDPDDIILIPLNTAKKRLFGEQYVDRIEIEVDSFNNMSFTEDAIIEAMLARKRIPPSSHESAFRVRNLAEIQQAAQESNRTLSFLLATIAGISLLVGGIGIMNIMLVSVTERTKEVGLRKAIGANRFDILMQFLIESVMISLVGGFLGILIGCVSAFGLSFVANWPTTISVGSIVLAFSFSVFIGIVFGIYPARKASYLQPIKALRFE